MSSMGSNHLQFIETGVSVADGTKTYGYKLWIVNLENGYFCVASSISDIVKVHPNSNNRCASWASFKAFTVPTLSSIYELKCI